MHGKSEHKLIVIENGQIKTYQLDDKLKWEVGRCSGDNVPDIRLYTTTISRKHGKFQNVDGIWFYMDYNGKNGTIYNKQRIGTSLNGRVKPKMLEEGDVFVFGGGETEAINSKTIWALFTRNTYGLDWRVEDTKGLSRLVFEAGAHCTGLENPAKGAVVNRDDGIAIYMGDVTYLSGNITVRGN